MSINQNCDYSFLTIFNHIHKNIMLFVLKFRESKLKIKDFYETMTAKVYSQFPKFQSSINRSKTVTIGFDFACLC